MCRESYKLGWAGWLPVTCSQPASLARQAIARKLLYIETCTCPPLGLE